MRGELVTRPRMERRGELRLIGGTSWQRIDAPPEVVWRYVNDVSKYDRMLPRVLEARVVKDEGEERTVYLRQGAGFIEVVYYLQFHIDDERRDLTFQVDPDWPHTLRAGWGFVNVQRLGGEQTLLAWGVMADVGDSLILRVSRGLMQQWMLKVPQTAKRLIEDQWRDD